MQHFVFQVFREKFFKVPLIVEILSVVFSTLLKLALRNCAYALLTLLKPLLPLTTLSLP